MKASLNWAQAHSNVPLRDISTDKLVEKIGAQIGAVEEVIDYGPRYEGIVVAKVISCEKHANADKLSICMVDDGGTTQNVARNEQGYVQVVCGAPNAREGLLVAWIPPGVAVPSSHGKEPFVLEAREIRGQISNGMLASPHELGINDDHDGILEIDQNDAKVGQPLKELFGLDDVIIDIENKMFTHRPDCFGMLGVAREIAGIQGKRFVSPDWYLSEQFSTPINQDVKLEIQVDEPMLVPRFMAVALKDITVGPSPIWLQAGLTRVGLKPINNIVDITNYLMYVTGQPLHAYDADKLPKKGSLGARLSKKGEKVNLLNGKQLELKDDNTVVIVSGDTVVGIGGVMGGKDTEVDSDTKNIVIECASFDMYNVRKTSMKYGLFTDAVTRFTKGQSNLQNSSVLAKAVSMTSEIAGGVQSSTVVDVDNVLVKRASVQVSAEFINERLGSQLSHQEIAQMLENVEFDIVIEDKLHVVAPFWRTDIEIPEDIVEEVGRLYGYDNLPVVLPSRPAKPATRNALLEFKTKIRNILSSAGANEVLTYSFVHGDLLKSVGQNPEHAYQLSNALSPDLQYFRMSLLPSLLDKVHPNIKSGFDEFAIYEMSKLHSNTYGQKDGLPIELETLAGVYACHSDAQMPAFYQVRKMLDYLAAELGIIFTYIPYEHIKDHPAVTVYDPNRSARIGIVGSTDTIGVIGEFTLSTGAVLKLPKSTAGFEIDIELLLEKLNIGSNYKKLSRFPKVQQDISLRVPADVNYQKVYDLLTAELLNITDTISDISPLDIFKREGDDDHVQMTFRFTISHYKKTLKSDEVNNILDNVAKTAKEKLNAVRL